MPSTKRSSLNKLNSWFKVSITFLIISFNSNTKAEEQQDIINLAGKWQFQIDSLNVGIKERWYNQQLKNEIQLPGSLTTNGIGNEIDLKTPWTGNILDSSYYRKLEYKEYRRPNNIKIPFWLQPVKYYKGVAWYQKTFKIPASFEDKDINLFLERPHWQTTVWMDGTLIGSANSLGTPHQFNIANKLKAGKHTLTIRVDNSIDTINVGQDSHSVSDNTQGNWNGIIGELKLQAQPLVGVKNIQVYPDVHRKEAIVKIRFNHSGREAQKAEVEISVLSNNIKAEKLKSIVKKIKINSKDDLLELIFPMGDNPLLWDEFNPDIYTLTVSLKTNKGNSRKSTDFGMREFKTQGTQLTINDKPIFLRGTLDCAVFPITGYPPTDVDSWMDIFNKIKSYGLNHIRYHSWTPPEAAFIAADRLGFYLQVECSSWASNDAQIGEGRPLDKYIYDESEKLIETYGNHPSFVMMAYGNEPKGKGHVEFLTSFVKYWQAKDSRRLYTSAAGWPIIEESDFHNPPQPRIQRWGEGLESIINAQAPKSNYNWTNKISKYNKPTVSHEIGQWCVYPDFKEIREYTGILKPKNFEIFEERLKKNDLHHLADSFLLASGKLQVLCYKADIEAALRTPNFGGFQLLGLNDFPGQGTALVGVLNAFWKDKGYITGKEFSQFCSSTVPLALFPKFVFYNIETFSIPVKLAHFGNKPLQSITPIWDIKDENGKILFSGSLPTQDITLGNETVLGTISQTLFTIQKASKLQLDIKVNGVINSWVFFVYPNELPKLKEEILITQELNKNNLEILNKGGKVLLTLKKGVLKSELGGDVKIGFSSIFWNTSYTNGQAPNTLGILCDPKHPAFENFPTEYHSNWQWWHAMMNSNAIRLNEISKEIKPIVRVIDDWYTANSLGLIFECKVGKGKLLVSGIDFFNENANIPEAKQLLYSLKKYMSTDVFNPTTSINISEIKKMGF